MIRARMFAIACGYEDCDDLDVLRFDPAFKLACGRLPETGNDLMSQPTLSRLENAPSWRQLGRMGLSMIDPFRESSGLIPDRIILDIDDTSDTVHGGRQLALFNGTCRHRRRPGTTAAGFDWNRAHAAQDPARSRRQNRIVRVRLLASDTSFANLESDFDRFGNPQ